MLELRLSGVKKYMDATLVLKDITFLVSEGEKVGIIGENGSGKSTILKLIAGVLPFHYCVGYPGATSPGYDEGFVIKSREAACAYLEQIPNYPEGVRVIDVLQMAFKEVLELELELRRIEDAMQDLEGAELDRTLRIYSTLMQAYEVKGGYEVDEKLNKICKGLKFGESFLSKEFNLLSGGEKTTVILGKLLIDSPEILLLDEPTNHLDMEAVEWLEEYLNHYKGMVLIVSHDRYFLDHVVTKIIEVEDKVCQTFRGNYTEYIRQKEEQLRVQYDHYRDQQKQINTMERSVKELRNWAMRADNNKFFQRAASIQIKLDKLDLIDKPIFTKRNMKLDFREAERSGNLVIKTMELSKRFEDKVIFQNANMLVTYGESVALIGPNGCGKTTLLRMLLGEEVPETGSISFGANVRAAYLPQKLTFTNEELTVLDCFREDIFILEGKAREYLAKFMFYGSTVYKKVRHLSGGERIRLKLSKLLFEDINLLILDEPTNHLDTDSIETIETALENFKGTIFFISHDRYFINKVAERVIVVENYGLRSYDGNYDTYKAAKEEMEKELLQVGNKASDKSGRPKVEDKKVRKTEDAKRKQEGNQLTFQLRAEDLELQIKGIDEEMNNPTLGYEELTKLYVNKEALTRELDLVMELWI